MASDYLLDWKPPVLDRYKVGTDIVAADRGMYGLDLTCPTGEVCLSQEGELLLLQLLLSKYPRGTASESVLAMHREVHIDDRKVEKGQP